MIHTVLTFITKVKPAQVGNLRKILAAIDANPEKNGYVSFRALTRVHFASFVLHEPSQPSEYGPYLVFENNFDGALEEYLPDLYRQAARGPHQIYSCCPDYVVSSATDRQGILDYLRAHVVYPNAYHVGNTGRSVERI